MKRLWILKPTSFVLVVALFAWAGSQSVRAQTFRADIQQFWNQLRTGGLVFTNIKATGGTISGVTISVNNPTFTGQWTVNGSLCAAGQLVQGGSPTTCTGAPLLSWGTGGSDYTTTPTLTVKNGPIQFQDAQITQGMTSFFANVNTYGAIGAGGTVGGLFLTGLAATANTTTPAFVITGESDADTTTVPVIRLRGGNRVGTSLGGVPAGSRLLSVANLDFNASGPDMDRFVVLGNGAILNNMYNLGTTSADGLALFNGAAATVGAQQFSPRLRWHGNGWKTDATAGSQVVDVFAELRPVQGTASPTSILAFAASINGGAYTDRLTLTSAGAFAVTGTAASGGLTPAGTVGTPVVVAYGNTVAATNTGTASIATVTPAVDTTYEVGCNVLVTTSTTHSFSCDVTYTDEGNVARTMVLPAEQLAGSFVTNGLITNVTGAGPYECPVMTIRAKASTAVTVRTSAGGTFTTVVYNARGVIKQVS